MALSQTRLRMFFTRIVVLAALSASLWLSVAGCSGERASGSGGAGAGGSRPTGGSGSGGTSDAGTSAVAATVDKFCTDVADALCGAYWACCEKPDALLGTSVANCKNKIGGLFEFCDPGSFGVPARKDLEASLQAGRTVFDQNRFDACLARLKSMSAGGANCVEPAPQFAFVSCTSAFQGQIAPGDACSWNGHNYVTSVVICKDGRCDNDKCIPFLKTGDSCHVPGSWGGPPDEACNYGNGEWCQGAYWVDGGIGSTGICGTPREIGGACAFLVDDRTDCKSQHCEQTGKCGPPLQTDLCNIF